MINYDLNRLGSLGFEEMCQALIKAVLKAPGTVTFGAGADGAREATFTGRAEYPSSKECWDGSWVFQAKFHDTARIGPKRARGVVITELDKELAKVVRKYNHKCDNYILLTNVYLSSTSVSGSHDRITQIVSKYPSVRVHVWGADDISRFLDLHPEVRTPYLHLVSPGELIAELLEGKSSKQQNVETIRLFVADSYERDQFAQLDQAGETDPDRSTLLREVFTDLDIRPQGVLAWSVEKGRYVLVGGAEDIETDDLGPSDLSRSGTSLLSKRVVRKELSNSLPVYPAASTIINGRFPRLVLVGGPGHGKSTLGQYVAQIHRAAILGRLGDLKVTLPDDALPEVPRIPFRVILKYLAQWLAERSTNDSLEDYLSTLIRRSTARDSEPTFVQEIFSKNACLLILDGLDEVSNESLRTKTLSRIREFVTRMEQLNSRLQVVCTTRPMGYDREFAPRTYLHFDLLPLSTDRAFNYARRWAEAKRLDTEDQQRVVTTFATCLNAEHTRQLVNTPLQVTIVLLIIKDHGQPPAQREALFTRFWDTLLSRERAKSKDLIRSEESVLFDLHAFCGYILHSRSDAANGRSFLAKETFVNVVCRFLRDRDARVSDVEIHERANALVKEAGTRLVMLAEVQPGYYGFELQSFQEYFAATYLVQSAANTTERFERLKAIGQSDYWRNVALFFVGRVMRTNAGEASNVLELVCRPMDRGVVQPFLKRGARLALDIAADRALASSPDLQYSAIEHSLQILEIPLSDSLREWVSARLRSLSPEEKKVIIRPLLQKAISAIGQSALPSAIETYGNLFGQDEYVQKWLEKLLKSKWANNKRTAIIMAAEQEVCPSLLSKWLKAHPQLRKMFLGHLSESGNLQYVLDVVNALEVSDRELEDILPSAHLESGLGDSRDLSPLAHGETQAIIRVAFNICARLASFEETTDTFDIDELGISIQRPFEPLEKETTQISVDLGNGSIPGIAAGLAYIEKLAVNETDQNIIQTFLSDVPRIAVSSIFWKARLCPLRPLVGLAAGLVAQGSEIPLLLSRNLSREIEEQIAARIKAALSKHVESNPEREWHVLSSALRLRDQEEISRRLPDFEELATSLGITSKHLVDAFIVRFTLISQRSDSELRYLLNFVKRTSDAKSAQTALNWMSHGKWKAQDSIWKATCEALIEFARKHSGQLTDWPTPLVDLFIRIADNYEGAWAYAAELFRILETGKLPFFPRVGPSRRLLSSDRLERFRPLRRFLKDKRTRSGALIVTYRLASAFASSTRTQRGRPARVDFLDWKLIVDSVADAKPTSHDCLLQLSSLCDVPIQRTTARELVRKALRDFGRKMEPRSIAYLSLGPVQPTLASTKSWQSFLVEVLARAESYSSAVVSSAVEALGSLCPPNDNPALAKEVSGLFLVG